MARAKLAVLVSGRGSNLGSLIRASKSGELPADITLVISNRPKAKALNLAKDNGIETFVLDHKSFPNGDEGRVEFDQTVTAHLVEAKIDFVCLAGFMRILTSEFVSKWRGKLVNIHPSLLPSFKGLNVHARIIDAGVKIAGCTVHFVSNEMDSGPIIGQSAIPVLPSDTEDTIAARILEQEHKLYPACMRMLVEGKARLTTGNRVALSLDNDFTPKAVAMPE